MLFMTVLEGGVAVVLLMMVVASCVVDDWQVVGWLGLNGSYVGFWVCSWRRERERERWFWVIYFIVWIYYFNVFYRKIKIRMLGVL